MFKKSSLYKSKKNALFGFQESSQIITIYQVVFFYLAMNKNTFSKIKSNIDIYAKKFNIFIEI